MRIDVRKNRIEGWCNIPGWKNEQMVVAFSSRNGEWQTASTMCLPTDIEQARIVHECISAAFDALNTIA